MLHILTVIGARPQIIKAAALSRTIRLKFNEKIRETLVHTGQHYDAEMSQVFFDELGVPAPSYNLGTGSGSHGKQTASMIEGLEKILLGEKPDAVVLYGDTNSTLAGAIAASKLHFPIVHIEAGLRSFNKQMPEEINRVLCDHVSTLLFSPTMAGFENLRAEGLVQENYSGKASADHPAVYHCGDVMYDNSLYFSALALEKSKVLEENSLQPEKYFLATVHRDHNTDQPQRFASILDAFIALTEIYAMPVVLPLHPRARRQLANMPGTEEKIAACPLLKILPPASFLDMILLEKNAKLVLTDSGGVQKEAFFFRKPCVILRSETEWVELVKCGAAILADAEKDRIIAAVRSLSGKNIEFPGLFGDGKAAEFMCNEMLRHFSKA
jgi:UDP-GlcNAc3NAcA epimerase